MSSNTARTGADAWAYSIGCGLLMGAPGWRSHDHSIRREGGGFTAPVCKARRQKAVELPPGVDRHRRLVAIGTADHLPVALGLAAADHDADVIGLEQLDH